MEKCIAGQVLLNVFGMVRMHFRCCHSKVAQVGAGLKYARDARRAARRRLVLLTFQLHIQDTAFCGAPLSIIKRSVITQHSAIFNYANHLPAIFVHFRVFCL